MTAKDVENVTFQHSYEINVQEESTSLETVRNEDV